MVEKSFIETQFPVSKISKESYKERKAGASQTLTGLGKWWGRKPLVLVRATILGCLLPATDNPAKDQEMFLKLMAMDSDGLWSRKEKTISIKTMYDIVISNKNLKKYAKYFITREDGKLALSNSAPKKEIEKKVFNSLGYDDKISICVRPENLSNIPEQSWAEVNYYYGTDADSITDFIVQMSNKRFGHTMKIGDCFCGGGSIPFESARLGCEAYGSDLNPVAGLLTWAGTNLSSIDRKSYEEYQTELFSQVEKEIDKLEIEKNERGDHAITYFYCVEAKCPECQSVSPLMPSTMIRKGTGTYCKIKTYNKNYSFEVISSPSQMKRDGTKGTIDNGVFICPHCGKSTPINVLRHDKKAEDGHTIYGLRLWGQQEFEFNESDPYTEVLYAVLYEHIEIKNGKQIKTRYYRSPNEKDLDNERKVRDYVAKNIVSWQKEGLVPTIAIEHGYNTDQLIRERGWGFWHQLFNPRQILNNVLFQKATVSDNQGLRAVSILSLNKMLNWNSKLCMLVASRESGGVTQTFANQALNTLFNYGCRTIRDLEDVISIPYIEIKKSHSEVLLKDARDVSQTVDCWITDPPYADAVNYHELTEFFLAWDKKLLLEVFPQWYSDSKRVLAIRGDEHFSQTMIDIYSNLTNHMNDDGLQVVMFTHSDPAVWAQLALIMWKAGLTVTAAWNIATETESGGLKDGNYVKGTVLLVMRKRSGCNEAFLDELTSDIKDEVKLQIASMQQLDDKEDPNFSDPDYVLAAYAASLKILTGYSSIEDIDLDYELNLAINDPAKSEVVKLIERAKKIAYDCIIPTDFDGFLWRELSPAERFYIKGIEAEKHGNYQISTYQEYARGFGLGSYGQLMASEKANTARLKTPSEFAMRTISDVPDFESSTLRIVLAAIHIGIKEENPEYGLFHLKTSFSDYWERRDMLKQILAFLKDTKDIDTMSHWHECAETAAYIYNMVDNDRI